MIHAIVGQKCCVVRYVKQIHDSRILGISRTRKRTHTCTHARTYARTHVRTHARTHARQTDRPTYRHGLKNPFVATKSRALRHYTFSQKENFMRTTRLRFGKKIKDNILDLRTSRGSFSGRNTKIIWQIKNCFHFFFYILMYCIFFIF